MLPGQGRRERRLPRPLTAAARVGPLLLFRCGLACCPRRSTFTSHFEDAGVQHRAHSQRELRVRGGAGSAGLGDDQQVSRRPRTESCLLDFFRCCWCGCCLSVQRFSDHRGSCAQPNKHGIGRGEVCTPPSPQVRRAAVRIGLGRSALSLLGCKGLRREKRPRVYGTAADLALLLHCLEAVPHRNRHPTSAEVSAVFPWPFAGESAFLAAGSTPSLCLKSVAKPTPRRDETPHGHYLHRL